MRARDANNEDGLYMNDRTSQLRRQSLDTPPSISGERAQLLTDFYQANQGRCSVPAMRARARWKSKGIVGKG